jgi:hypothetical protein
VEAPVRAAAAAIAEIITRHSTSRLLIGPTSGLHDSACRQAVIAQKRQLL